eukprot:TRINITY_DN55202_c0_g1_i1.p1 TRINITY_DN55202_c0_g1~~TRINITY_DN55202_c0_g1_i1.p1  ORF type:complete len:761 (+),score=65.70 TRINITY_DN55202_c0_g1_i1:32-2314(+)
MITGCLSRGCTDGWRAFLHNFGWATDEYRLPFEKAVARIAFKYEVGYVIALALLLLVSRIISVTTEDSIFLFAEDASAWSLAVASAVLRCLFLLGRNRLAQFRACPHFLAALLMLIDFAILASLHPASSHFKMRIQPTADTTTLMPECKRDEPPASIQGAGIPLEQYVTDVEAWKAAEAVLLLRQEDTHTMVVFLLQLYVWYMVVFVLLLKYVVVALPLCLAVYCTRALNLWGEIAAALQHTDDDMHDELFLNLDEVVQEVILLGVSMLVALAAKKHFERIHRHLFVLVEEKSQLVVQERVLRCRAEFAKEVLTGHGPWAPECTSESASSYSVSMCRGYSSAQPASRNGAPSVKSAPAAPFPLLPSLKPSGECLPLGAGVWVEGHGLPQAVEAILPGQRILCYDRLAMCTKYVDVLEANVLEGQTSWVVVDLADGTSLTLTADHPVHPRPSEGVLSSPSSFSLPVAAANLRPGLDSLMTLRTDFIGVSRVHRIDTNASKEPSASRGMTLDERVAISVKQPERFEVLVTSQKGAAYAAGTAVGSSVLPVASLPDGRDHPGNARLFGLTMKRTFLSVDDYGATSQRRAASAPPSIQRGGCTDIDDSTRENSAKATVPVRDGVKTFQRSNSDSQLTRSDDSMRSHSVYEADVLVAVSETDAVARVSDLLNVYHSGLPSRGSVAHSLGQCRPCVFENRRQHCGGPKCFRGVLCDRCHDCHEMVKKPRQSGDARRIRKNRNRSEGSRYDDQVVDEESPYAGVVHI